MENGNVKIIKIGRREMPLRNFYAIYGFDYNEPRDAIRHKLHEISNELMQQGNPPQLDDEIRQMINKGKACCDDALYVFRSDNYRTEYDSILKAAIEAGEIDTKAQIIAKELYDELRALFLRREFSQVINRCLEAINNDIHDYRLYLLLANSYYALHNVSQSLQTVEDGLKTNLDNLALLQAGARFANEGNKDFDCSQRYIDKMLKVDAESSLAHAEQAYLYLSEGKEVLAFDTMNKYLEKHPSDTGFRKTCAYNLVDHSYSFYTHDPESNSYVIASKQDYEKCLETCNKAASMYQDQTVNDALRTAQFFGTKQFNEDNFWYIVWLVIGGLFYSLTVVGAVLGIPLLFCAWRLYQVSQRPYWQIHQYNMTGRREPGENMYILIGKIFTGYLKWSAIIAWHIIKFIFGFMLRG